MRKAGGTHRVAIEKEQHMYTHAKRNAVTRGPLLARERLQQPIHKVGSPVDSRANEHQP